MIEQQGAGTEAAHDLQTVRSQHDRAALLLVMFDQAPRFLLEGGIAACSTLSTKRISGFRLIAAENPRRLACRSNMS